MYRLVFAVFLAFPNLAAADPAVCIALRDSMPDAIGSLDATEKHDFEAEQPGLGYSAGFVSDSRFLTAYFSDFGKPSFDEHFLAELLKTSIVGIEVRLKSVPASFELLKAFQFEREDLLFRYFAIGKDSLGNGQFIAIGVLGDCIVKLRYTDSALPEQSTDTFLAMTAAVDDALQ